jgi:hypothetical protein
MRPWLPSDGALLIVPQQFLVAVKELEAASSHALACAFTACTCGAAERRRKASLAVNRHLRELDAPVTEVPIEGCK